MIFDAYAAKKPGWLPRARARIYYLSSKLLSYIRRAFTAYFGGSRPVDGVNDPTVWFVRSFNVNYTDVTIRFLSSRKVRRGGIIEDVNARTTRSNFVIGVIAERL